MSFWNVTERKEAEAKLRESEERFRRVFEEGPLGVGLVARDHRFLKVNSALCRMVGYSEDELLQKTFADITHTDDMEADVALADQLFKGEIPFYRLQKRYVKKTGEIIWINLTASIIRAADGEPIHGLKMVEDITEAKRNQEETFAMQKLESVGTLAGGIAHDFNNILGAVLAQAEVAMAELAQGSRPHQELRAISEAALRGSEIVRELMIYAGKETGVRGSVDVSQVVEEMLELLKISVSKHAVLDTDLGQHLPAVGASAAQISQLVMNLVSNASEALGDRDGVVCITTRRVIVGHGSLERERVADGEYVQLEVSDTGKGMSRETQVRLFDPFFSTKSAGRGLGLAVVHGIVRDLQGTIHVASEPNHGTTFQILLPCASTVARGAADTASDIEELSTPATDATVLVVEDEDFLRQAVTKFLTKIGFEVLEAADGTSAIDLIRVHRDKVDVILLDMTIPGASSAEVIAEAERRKPAIGVVLTSAYGQEMVACAMGAPQVHSFIRKPFQLADLVQTLRNALTPRPDAAGTTAGASS